MSEPWDSPERYEREPAGQSFDSERAPQGDEAGSNDLAAIELTEADLLPVRPPGPGLGEALLWTVGVLSAHGIGMLVAFFAVAPFVDGDMNLRRLAKDSPDAVVAMIGIEQLVFIALAFAAVAIRFRGRLFRALPSTPIRIRHAVMIGLLVFPLALCGSKLSELFRDSWNAVADRVPELQKFEEQIEAIELLSKVAGEASFPLLLLVIAVAPAIGEELVFRGVIGRGLTARWGLVAGVLITSVLFGLVHGDPVHVVGVIPLGIMMHVIYLATRSFWAPVLFHFANNAMAATGLKMAAIAGAAEQAPMQPPELPLFVYVAAVVCVVSLALLLWRSRVRYHMPDGSIWNPGYLTVERPPAHLGAESRCRPVSPWLVVFAGACVLAFGLSFIVASLQAVMNA